ncbi:MAG: hypothetical protein L3J36_14870 [Rhodobacteraceae bacterium]|nr:hypothetical protein [Paracoccaceae bacterium]
MRPVLHGDISNAARALLYVPVGLRASLCERMILESEAADEYVARVGRLHPLWGNGSLMSAARKRMLADEPTFDDADYCACFEMVLRRLAQWRANR